MLPALTLSSTPQISLETERLTLITPRMNDYDAWRELREQSADFLKPFEPIWPADDLSRAAFKRRLHRFGPGTKESMGIMFLFFTHQGELVGSATISRMLRGVAQSCSIGYWIGQPYTGNGYMVEALKGLMPFVFVRKKFKRLEAACLPHNIASIRVLQKAGFTEEGYARQYLKIAGFWQDHLLFAILESDFNQHHSTNSE